MPTYPLPTLAPSVGASGITAPSYSDILESLKASFRTIYGADAYLEADSQDGQLLAIFAKAVADSNDVAIWVYNSMSPQTALGAALSSRVKMNGLERNVPSNSQVSVIITGTVGSTIINGRVRDNAGHTWTLPSSVTIPAGGFTTVTATCTEPGAISADPHTVTQIATPTLGWQSVDNVASASEGAAVETDPELKLRQARSVALPALSITSGVIAAVAALDGVTDVVAYDNDTGSTDGNGIPAHHLSLVVTGGDDAQVAQTIGLKKGPGAGTFGNTSITVTDASGFPKAIKFYRPAEVALSINLTVKALAGYNSSVTAAIKQSLVDYIDGLHAGDPVYITRLYLPAQLFGSQQGAGSFELTTLLASKKPAAPGSADLTFLIYQKAALALADINLTVI